MTKEEKKKEITYHGAVREFDNTKTIVTNVGFEAGTDDRYEIVWPIPATDVEAKERYDCNLAELVAAGIRQLATRPDYKSAGFDEFGNLLENGHEAMQALADGYKVGARKSGGVTQKVKAAEYDALMAEAKSAGLTPADIMEMVRKAKGE